MLHRSVNRSRSVHADGMRAITRSRRTLVIAICASGLVLAAVLARRLVTDRPLWNFKGSSRALRRRSPDRARGSAHSRTLGILLWATGIAISAFGAGIVGCSGWPGKALLTYFCNGLRVVRTSIYA